MTLKKRARKVVALLLVGLTISTPLFNTVSAMEIKDETSNVIVDDYNMNFESEECSATSQDIHDSENISYDDFIIIDSNDDEMIIDKKGNNTYVSDVPNSYEHRGLVKKANKVTPGPWKNVKYIGSKSRKLSSPYTRERIIQTIQYGLGFLSGGASFLLGMAESIYRQKVYDVTKYGGVYTKTYYRRQITDVRNSKTNVPVPYRYEYVTYFYSSSNFSKVVYTERVGAGIKLANN